MMKGTQVVAISFRVLAWGVVMGGVIMSAFAIVYCKDLYRRVFIESQQLDKQHAALLVQKSRLILEDGTWSSQLRVQRIAKQTLKMKSPEDTHFLSMESLNEH